MRAFDLEAIKRALPVERVLELAGIVGHRGRYRCPCKPEGSPTLSVFRNSAAWHCHRCHRGGSVIDVVQFLEGVTVADAIRHCAGLAGIGPVIGQAVAKRPPDPAVERRRVIAEKFREVAATRDVLQRIADDDQQPIDVRLTALVASRKANLFLDAVITEGAR